MRASEQTHAHNWAMVGLHAPLSVQCLYPRGKKRRLRTSGV